MDGHTSEGGWPVTLDLTADEVEMLVRSIRWAVMASGSGLDSSGHPKKPMEMIAYQEFLKQMINKMEEALKEQHP